jgi:hypothetical protein
VHQPAPLPSFYIQSGSMQAHSNARACGTGGGEVGGCCKIYND